MSAASPVERFTHTRTEAPASASRRAEILANPGFGAYFTDHMATVRWTADRGWHDAQIQPYAALNLDPASMVLHYAQSIFEGLKAYRQPDGSVAAFRPEANAARMRSSARRLAMPELPDELFEASLRELLAEDQDWVPEHGGEASLYLRPLMIAYDVGLGVKPAGEYLYILIASPAGSYFPGGVSPVSVWLSTEYVRAAPGGTGAAKFSGNYAASLAAQANAAEQGCDQVVWLDAIQRRYIEEMGGMNLFFVAGSGDDARLITPALSGSLLPGITRDSLLQLAKEIGLTPEERLIATDELENAVRSGEITEVFACGTAAVITPVGSVKHQEGGYTIGDGSPGPVTMQLRERLTSLQRGTGSDSHGWMTRLC